MRCDSHGLDAAEQSLDNRLSYVVAAPVLLPDFCTRRRKVVTPVFSRIILGVFSGLFVGNTWGL